MESLVASALQNSQHAEKREFKPEEIRISVVGVGGGGTNTVHRLKSMGIQSAKTIAINTDANHLKNINADKKMLIGASITKGMGAGGYVEVGQRAAEGAREKIAEALDGSELVFVTTGLGGGTGTGAAPVVAEVAKKIGAITIGVVTFPFALERARLEKADWGLEQMRKACDTVIIVDNNKLLTYVPNLPMNQAFQVADTLLSKSVKGISDTIMLPSLMNIDFADVKMIVSTGDVSMISVGEGKGSNKVQDAIDSTLAHPLLDVNTSGAKGALILITGSSKSLSLGDAVKIGEGITQNFDQHAYVKWGARITEDQGDSVQVTAVLTGVNSDQLIGGQKTQTKETAPYQMQSIQF
jgi:cell division protein FtsZ